MFDCGPKSKSNYLGGQRERFVRLDELDSRSSSPSAAIATNKCGFSIEGLGLPSHMTTDPSKSYKRGTEKGSQGLMSIGRSLGFGVSRAVFPEDLKVSEKKIFDPQDKFLLSMNKFFVISCIIAVSIDPLFFYLPVYEKVPKCLGIDRNLAIVATTLRTVVDVFYLIHMALQFRTAYIAPSSRVFGRGELVIDPAKIAKRYLLSHFIIDFLAVLPIPQIVVWRFLQNSKGSDVLATKQALLAIVLLQYIPRLLRFIPLTSELKRTEGVFAETAWAGAVYYLLLYMLASHIVGAFWYWLSVDRYNTCWENACKSTEDCITDFLYCGNQNLTGYDNWGSVSDSVLDKKCAVDGEKTPFDFGIFKQALSSGIVYSRKFVSKYCYCLWWGLQNLSTLGQGLQTSTFPGESIFSIALAIFGLILFALLIGNMQTYLQSLTIRLEEMRVKRRDSALVVDTTEIPLVYAVGPNLNLTSVGQDIDEAADVFTWLDEKPLSSVVFLCFGSYGSFLEDQVKEIALALEHSGHPFLWSLRPSGIDSNLNKYANLDDMLPPGFLERTSGTGKIIGWAPQVAVLSHRAVGGFVSHCGWNSILESVWFGVPVATWPLYAEQQLNAFEMVNELEMAVDISIDYDTFSKNTVIIEAKIIESKIRELMKDGSDIRNRVTEIQRKSRAAIAETGSSYNNLGRLIEDIIAA